MILPPPNYRVRFVIVNLTAKNQPVKQMTLNAWRVTFIINGNGAVSSLLNVVDFGSALANSGAVVWTVGGVFMPDGTPAVVDQVISVDSIPNNFLGILVLEYLEPI